jgi:hypothetical protein
MSNNYKWVVDMLLKLTKSGSMHFAFGIGLGSSGVPCHAWFGACG